MLDRQPAPPRGSARAKLLHDAGGNPLALVELSRALAERALEGRPGWADATLPLTTRLEAVFADRLAVLPAETRRALLLAAAADASAIPDCPEFPTRAELWRAAEEAGLVRVEGGRVAFTHPLVRSAVYQQASSVERQAAHRSLADAATADPDRRARHLAAAALSPDDEVARALQESARRAQQRGGFGVAASIMERAARLSRDPAARVRRLVETYSLATFVCDPVWVESLATEIATLTDDARLLQQTALSAAWALAATSRQGAAVSRMIPLAAATVESDPVMALGALTKGAIALYYTGEEAYRRQAAELLARIPVDVGDPMDQVWARVCADPFTDRAGHLDRLRAATDRAGLVVEEYTTLGGAAWMLDETPLALRLLAAGADRAQATPDAVANPTLTQALALAQFESGAWEAASATAHRARRGAAEAGIGMPGRVAAYVSAALHVHRGEPVDARRALEQARSGVDLTQLRGLDASCRGVEAAAATAEGKHILAYALLRSVFTGESDTGPLHYHASYYALGDLAAAAVRAGESQDARRVLDAARRALAGPTSPRLAAQVARARALLATDAQAERHFQAAVSAPEGNRWPFERAVALLEYGEWLRRRRRPHDARARLTQALALFERLAARPWADRAAAELRACGGQLGVLEKQDSATGAAALTPQQLQISRLAATGLTNRQIGERLFLSARTVGFHLHQAFPKLGITSRSQLRDVLGSDD
ncbi:LuxR C-terminal-related transcriptional regulator [Streptacidiphilus monticola]|uniref:LuxR C-terminal-related transcriptional regulator n=1 Tax=Streptacidiphilus monticola TaxID=2161674 RepID=A0ABW1GAK1_9ACTN